MVDTTVLVKLKQGLMLVTVSQPEPYDLKKNRFPKSDIKIIYYNRHTKRTKVYEQHLQNQLHTKVDKYVGDGVMLDGADGYIQWLPRKDNRYKLSFTYRLEILCLHEVEMECTEESMQKLVSCVRAYDLPEEKNMRIWQNQNGQLFDGRLMYLEDGFAFIRGSLDYKLYKVDPASLSKLDQQFIKKFEEGG